MPPFNPDELVDLEDTVALVAATEGTYPDADPMTEGVEVTELDSKNSDVLAAFEIK